MFLHVSVCPQERGGIPACLAGGIPACLAGLQWGVSQHALPVSRPTPRGELEGLAGGSSGLYLGGGKLRSLAWGVSRPTPWGISRPTPWGCIPACTEADPPPRWLLLRAVRILLECILVLLVALFIPILDETF